MFFPSVRHNTERISCLGKEEDDLHRKRNFELCRAIDTIKLKIVLNDMVATGHIKQEMADLYLDQVSITLAILLSENNRVHNF